MHSGVRRVVGSSLAVGALAGGIVLGTGSASADTLYCLKNDVRYTSLSLALSDNGLTCPSGLDDLIPLSDSGTSTEPSPPAASSSVPTSPVTLPPVPSVDQPAPNTGSTPKTDPTTQAGSQPANTPTGNGNSSQQPLLAAAPAAAGLTTGGAAPAGTLPSDFSMSPYAPALMASGVYDPALLLGPGASAPALQALSPSPASAISTVSQVQAMALNAPAPLGIGAMVGVVIIAGLGGLVLRQRLVRRGKKATTS